MLDELNVKVCEASYLPSEMVNAARAQLGDQPEGVVLMTWPPAGGDGNGDGETEHRYSVALDHASMVAIDTTLTDDLRDEGTAREVVHRIQNLRRNAGFELTDRIITYFSGEQGMDDLRRVMSEYGPYIQQETLSDRLVEGAPPEGSPTEKLKLERGEVVLAVQRV